MQQPRRRCRLPRGRSTSGRRATVRELLDDTACRVQTGERRGARRGHAVRQMQERGNIRGNIRIVRCVRIVPHVGTIRTVWRDADGYDTRVTRLRAWSGITGWRFESSSAHERRPRLAGLLLFSGVLLRVPAAPLHRSAVHALRDSIRWTGTAAGCNLVAKASRSSAERCSVSRPKARACEALGPNSAQPALRS